MGPLDILANYGKPLGYLVTLLIGVGFGASLEFSGFGDSRKLAGQFYLRDMTVFKVMFTAIIVAMTLVFTFSSLHLINFDKVFVDETYLLPGTIGGFIMGLGFIIGGFCPGTSIVAASTLKIDAIFFLLGGVVGSFFFGETVGLFTPFYNSTYMGRFTLPQLFNIPTGVVVILVILMAVFFFYWAEISEKIFGEKMKWAQIDFKAIVDKKKAIAVFALLFIAMIALVNGQPTNADKWDLIKQTENKKILKREIFVSSGEVFDLIKDPMLYHTFLDVRLECDYNKFHLESSKNIKFNAIEDSSLAKELKEKPANNINIIMSNDETLALKAYRILRAQGVINIYILNGGINNWLKQFPLPEDVAVKKQEKHQDETLGYKFYKTVGDIVWQANPTKSEEYEHHKFKYKANIKVQKKKVLSGGCG